MERRARRLLFLFAKTGGGHTSIAHAVAHALRERYGARVHVEMVDVLSDYAPWPFNRLDRIYPSLVQMRGWLWAVGYNLSDGPRRAALLTRSCWPMVRGPLLQLLYEHPADVIACCHPTFNHLIAQALNLASQGTSLVTLVSDLATAHAFWFAPGAARYLVPVEGARQRALICGIAEQRILVTGLPVHPRFLGATKEPVAPVRRRLGLRMDRPVVLLAGGAEGMGSLRPLCQAAVDSKLEAQLVVLTGRNGRLKARLTAEKWPLPIRIEGFVHNMHDWMRAADILVTKAGPSTISEALVMGLPLVLSGALPGQERPNADYVVQAGAAIWAPTPDRVIKTVHELLNPDRQRLAEMSARAQAIAHPNAAQRVASVLWDVAGGDTSLR